MATYKVSYKVLRQQGEDMKAAAKLLDGYADRVGKVRGNLGDDNMLAEIRRNLGALATALGESRTVLNTAGELLIKNVENYGGVETRQVKKVDGMRAHNRDFYKKPVVVASAGGAAGGAAVAGAASAPTPTVTPAAVAPNASTSYAAPEPIVQSAAEGSFSTVPLSNQASAPQAANAAASIPSSETPKAADLLSGMSTAAKAGIGAAGAAAVAAGGILGGREIKKRRDGEKQDAAPEPEEGDLLEMELEKARKRVSELENSEEE